MWLMLCTRKVTSRLKKALRFHARRPRYHPLHFRSDRLSCARLPVPHQLVAWQGLIDHLLRSLNSSDRKSPGIQNTDLYQDRGLIPVDMFVIQLVAPEADHGEHGNLDVLASWRQPWKHPVDLAIVGCTENEFVDNAVRTDGARDRNKVSV